MTTLHGMTAAKIYRLLFIVFAIFASVILATQIPMKVGAITLAQQSTFDTFKTKLSGAVETRLNESSEINQTISEANYLPADVKKNIQNDNNANTAALTTIKSDLDKSKTAGDLKATAQKLDSQYSQSQFNVQQGAVAKNLDTQQDAAQQLQGMVDQANSLMQQCVDKTKESASHEHQQGETDTHASASQECSNVSSGSGSGGSGGGIDVSSIISKVAQLLVAVVAIIASITALILAIQNGEYEAAMILLATIVGQLEAIASILSEAFEEIGKAIEGMGGSTSEQSGNSGGSSSGSSSGNSSGETGGGTSNSAGLLPVGDGKYTTSGAKKGYVYVCGAYAERLKKGGPGADKRGPWFTNNNTKYDPSKKTHVQGSVRWNGTFSNNLSGGMRTINTNNVPGGHTTGKFPIGTNDPAYSYDRNPNSIKEQSITYSLPAAPTYSNPQCMGNQSGVMLSGVLLFNALDHSGRDAGAWETQDSCDGHPEDRNRYHYHTLSNCISAVDSQTVIGFALDGFPITGAKLSSGKELMTNDLDECHGMSGEITLDGKKVNSYHYVMTKDFPYSVSCFRSTPVQ